MSDQHEPESGLDHQSKIDSPETSSSITSDVPTIDHAEKMPGSSRGIQTMLVVTYQNHIQLSQLADGKANTLISINGVIISIVIALVAPQLETLGGVVAPSLALLVGCTISLIFSVIASRPRLNRKIKSPESIHPEDINLLFFGDFLNISAEQFTLSMRELMRDRQSVYDKMVHEIYSMGRVLEKKYHRLQLAFNSFLATLIIAVSLFVITFLQHLSAA